MCELTRTELRKIDTVARAAAAVYDAGWNDEALLHAIAVCAYFNNMNRASSKAPGSSALPLLPMMRSISLVNVEPAAAESMPDTAASDAGAASAKPAQRKSALDAYAAQTGQHQKPAQRRPRPRLNYNAWAHQPPNFSSFGSRGW